MNKLEATGLICAVLIFVTPAIAAEDTDKAISADHVVPASMPETPLADILESVGKKTGKKFLVDARVQPEVVVGQLKSNEVTYAVLLTILRNNDLAAASMGDIVNVVPTGMIRQYPLPVLYEDDDSFGDEEWVTRVIRLENAPAAQLVPIMRPLLPRAGHMAANPLSNTIIIVDRHANVRRVTEMIQKLDSLTPPQPD